jgi:hypothetical protein
VVELEGRRGPIRIFFRDCLGATVFAEGKKFAEKLGKAGSKKNEVRTVYSIWEIDAF